MNKLIEILVLVLLIAVASALPTGDGEFRLKIYSNKLKISLNRDQKI
jgi:hypothetical protein